METDKTNGNIYNGKKLIDIGKLESLPYKYNQCKWKEDESFVNTGFNKENNLFWWEGQD